MLCRVFVQAPARLPLHDGNQIADYYAGLVLFLFGGRKLAFVRFIGKLRGFRGLAASARQVSMSSSRTSSPCHDRGARNLRPTVLGWPPGRGG